MKYKTIKLIHGIVIVPENYIVVEVEKKGEADYAGIIAEKNGTLPHFLVLSSKPIEQYSGEEENAIYDLCEKILKDGSFAATGFIPSGLATSPDGVDFRKDSGNFTSYDKKKAQESLDEGLKELGKDQITLRFTYGKDESPKDVFVTYLQNALSELDGIKVEMVATTKQDRIYNKQKNGDFDLATTRWGPDYGDPTTYLTIALSTNSSNYGKYTNSELDALMDKVANESDANTRWQEMKDAEKILLADYAYIPVFEKGAATLQNPKVKNLVIKPCRTISFEYVEKTE